MKLTENDKRNLGLLPDGWFEEIDMWPQIKRTYYCLRRLYDVGLIEIKYKGDKCLYRRKAYNLAE